jgi:hypothetical protein
MTRWFLVNGLGTCIDVSMSGLHTKLQASFRCTCQSCGYLRLPRCLGSASVCCFLIDLPAASSKPSATTTNTISFRYFDFEIDIPHASITFIRFHATSSQPQLRHQITARTELPRSAKLLQLIPSRTLRLPPQGRHASVQGLHRLHFLHPGYVSFTSHTFFFGYT